MVALVRARWRLFRTVALAVIAVGLIAALLWPVSYSTSAAIMLEPQRNNVTDQTSVLSETPTDPASIQNQIQLLTSRDLAGKVVETLGLQNDPEFNGTGVSLNPLSWLSDGRRLGRDAVVTAFLRHVSVEPVGLSTTIEVTVSSRDPAKAALIANTMLQSYLDMQAAIRFDITQRTTAWLLDRIHQLGGQVQAAEADVQRYKAENDLNDTSGGGSLVDQQLAAVNAQLVQAQENLAARGAESARISSLLRDGRAADVSQIISSPLIIQLREQETDLIRQEALLTAHYGPKHPKMLAAEAQKRDVETKIAEEVGRLAGSADNDVSVARAQVQSLENTLQNLESEARGQNMARVRLQSLEANAASTRNMYEAFVSRLRETQGQDASQMVDARIISHAPVPGSPNAKPRMLIALASAPAGLLLGLLAVLLAARFAENGGSVRQEDGDDMRQEPVAPAPRPQDAFAGAPVLAELPPGAAIHAAEWIVTQPMSPGSVALRALAQRMVGRAKVVAVTAVDPREGKTGFAIALARAAAQLGARVVLLDPNLEAPAVAFRAGVALPDAGIAEALRGAAPLRQAFRHDGASAMLVLSPSRQPASSPGLWGAVRGEKLMAHLRRTCDLVIVDAPAIGSSSAFPRLCGLADAVIVFAASTGAPRADLPAAVDYLRRSVRRPLGIVLAR